jgi:hypothetical protein
MMMSFRRGDRTLSDAVAAIFALWNDVRADLGYDWSGVRSCRLLRHRTYWYFM